jgi:hypothetical protein
MTTTRTKSTGKPRKTLQSLVTDYVTLWSKSPMGSATERAYLDIKNELLKQQQLGEAVSLDAIAETLRYRIASTSGDICAIYKKALTDVQKAI